MIIRIITAIALQAMAFCVLAQVEATQIEVIDRSLSSPQNTMNNEQAAPSAVNSDQLSEMYYSMQMLQQEVQQLRGTVEQLDYQVKQLKQQRLDDYLDLDRRLSRLGTSNSLSKRPASSSVSSDAIADIEPAQESIEDSASAEISSYRQAMDLVLKKKEYDKGADALIAFLERFPSGRYAGNAQYWLAEIYLQKDDLSKAQKWFSNLINIFPSHSKVIDAKFKLGTVYFRLGDKVASKAFLDEVAASNTSTASLAQDFLRNEFSP